MKPVAFFDTYAGGGGAAEGALQAGAIVPLAWECWFEKNKATGEYEITPHQPALDVHAANHPQTKVRQVPMGANPEWEVKVLKEWFRVYRNRGYHIHLHGSPPCQALSNASSTNADEGMVQVNHYLWLVEQTEPDSWSMENVVPLKKKLGDRVPSVILNSADYGVPQTRRRCFAGEGWEATPTHTKEEWVSVLEALPHLQEEVASLVPVPSMTEQYKNADIEKPYPTVTSQSPKQLKMKATKLRSLTITETATLQGFRQDYDWSPAQKQKYRWTIIGNAVPPPMMAAVIRGIQQ